MSYRNRPAWAFAAIPAGLLLAAFAVHANLENVESGSRLESVFFRSYPVANGANVIAPRPPKETRAYLTKLIAQAPTEADLLSLRALEDERQLDFAAAEADWRKFVELSADKAQANLSLADYFHRRLMPRDEIAALRAVAASAPDTGVEPPKQRAWQAFERIAALIDDQLLDGAFAAEQYRAWVARYPKDPEAYRRACSQLTAKQQFAAADEILNAYERAFPGQTDFPTETRAAIELARGSEERARAVYEKSFQPLWPEPLAAGYFALLKDEGLDRKFADQTRAEIAAHPADLNPAAKLYYYFRQQQTDAASAARTLVGFRKRKEAAKSAWTPEEHETLAILFDRTNQYDDAARHYHALYVHPKATAAQTELALAGIVDLLLNAADQPIRIGAADLSYYRDVSTMDPSPGYLNGILSLLLNSADPEDSYHKQNEVAQTYFHRVKAAELDRLFEQKYPKSERRAGLRAKLIQAYATYGDTQAVIDNGKLFLSAFPNAPQRTEIALMTADGYARLERTDDEFAVYRALLIELAAKAGGKPIGTAAVAAGETQEAPPAGNIDRAAKPDAGVRSQNYVQVLDRYLARLVSMDRVNDALRVYRNEIARNADDPGLYERFAAFLDQNKLGSEIERVYRDAMAHFPDDKQWSNRLARWYLREKQQSKYAELTRQVTHIFSGTDLQSYLESTAGGGNVGAQMYFQVNLYAHQRFPHDLAFVRNLLLAYQTRGTANPVAYEQLLRQNWYWAADLRARFFELLSRTGRLDSELASLRTMKPDAEVNPAAAQMLAEAEVWKTNYEAAAQPFRLLAATLPADSAIDARAGSLERSLDRTDLAVQIEANLAKANPRNRETWTRIGEIEADHERYDRAAAPWLKMASLEPGKPDGYLDAATVFWDYFQFNDAINVIDQARKKLGNPALFAYEAGAIRENQRDYSAALNEYAQGALAEGEGRCRERLLRLAKRPKLAAQAEAVTRRIGASPQTANIGLRIAFLEGQSRPADLQAYLSHTLQPSTSPEVIALVEASARSNEMKPVLQQAIERRIAITSDPAERLRERMELAGFFEAQGDSTKAAATIDALYRENPAVAGVIRGTVNYYWRNKQPARAVDILVASADRAQQPYQDRFRFEAAQKAIESGQYDRGQQLISALLDKDPYRADYLAVGGDLYARKGDDSSLRSYYLNTIESLRKSLLPAAERISRVAALRRSLIPVLTRLKDSTGATDQYIEVINRYPEDEGLVRDAALYALQHGQLQRLTGFYTKTAASAMRDHRWPIVLARIEMQAENLPAALDWYDKARAIRPERTDFLAAKAPIEERLMRFEDAAKTYTALWELSYHDPTWMVKCAEQYERLGRHDDAVAAIRKAYIVGRPETPANYLSAASQAGRWNLLDAAQGFLDQGLALHSKESSGLRAFEGELAARRHRPLPAPWKDMDRGTANRWGEAVARYATPEEKAALERTLNAQTGYAVAAAAGFAELATRWQPPVIDGNVNPRWIELEKLRAKIGEIGPRLEEASKNGTYTGQQRDSLLFLARQYYAQAGNSADELRLLEQRRASGMSDLVSTARYAELAARDQKRALAIASSDPLAGMRDAVANQVLLNGNAADALAIVQARGRGLKPVWTNAYTALTGVYFDIRSPQVHAAFASVLGSETIGEQLGHRPDEAEQVAGGPWYYYASRFGEYLTDGNDPAGADYMLARLEASPGSPAAYEELADFYRERGDSKRALLEDDYVLQLDPSSPVPHVRKAALLASAGDMSGAHAEWKLAFAGFERTLDKNPSTDWWSDLASALTDIGRYKLLASLRDDASRVLRANFKRNGGYNAEVLVPAIFAAPGDPGAGAEWLAGLSRSAPEPNQILDLALRSAWLPESQRDRLYAKEVEIAQAKADAAMGDAKVYLRESVVSLQLERIRDSAAHGNTTLAERLLQELPSRVIEANTRELATIRIRISARRGTLDELLARYRRDPEHAPDAATLKTAASQLREAKDESGANRVLEFLYGREIENRNFTAANFLGLAEVNLANRDLAAALELLRRMNLTVGAPFELLGESGNLLWRTGHLKEAAEYYDRLAKVEPWTPEHRLHAALVKLESGDRSQVSELSAVAQNPAALYATRVEAAEAIRKAGGVDSLNSGVGELDLIAGKSPMSETQASQPFYIPSRLLAAREARDPAVRFRLLSAAVSIAPLATGRPRLELFRSAVETHRWFLANSLMEGSDFETGLPAGERLQLLTSLAEVKRRTGDGASALEYENRLLALLDGPRKTALERSIAAQNAAIERRMQNEARRPVIGEALLPDRIVRPRLTGGGVQ